MKVRTTALPGVLVVEPVVHTDVRGSFRELHRDALYAAHGIGPRFVQTNHSHSVRDVVRGLHWQISRPQGKLVSVLHGEVLDVVVDVCPRSPRFRQWVAVRLDATHGTQLWVPPGYAHGYRALTDTADVLYACTDVYVAGDGRGLRFDDPALAIDWGIEAPIQSDADRALPTLETIDHAQLPVFVSVA